MSRKEELLEEIQKTEAEIKDAEQKLLRSQSSLLEALLDKIEPPKSDVQYFKTLLSIIRLGREKLQLMQDELDRLAD